MTLSTDNLIWYANVRFFSQKFVCVNGDNADELTNEQLVLDYLAGIVRMSSEIESEQTFMARGLSNLRNAIERYAKEHGLIASYTVHHK